MKQLIINADDFGLHEEINKGIIDGHRNGCITSTTLIAGGAAFTHAVELAKQCPDLSVGVHLTLVGTKPVARGDVHSLICGRKFFPGYYKFVQAYLLGRIDKKHIAYELGCQMQKIAGSGIKISHIDSHQHLHILPGLADVIVALAADFKVDKIRIPQEPLFSFKVGSNRPDRIAARSLLTLCAFSARRNFGRRGLRSPAHFFGILAGGTMGLKELHAIISDLPEGTAEIMVHPGANNTLLRRAYPWDYHWEEELRALKDEDILKLVSNNDIKLINYRQF
ncbi:MAG TPA: ChbG/HpnK family deacetylase [Negativicutes bacterium]|nr:ChbG/HpnK family deacetylase [Negativicutes bacterium]